MQNAVQPVASPAKDPFEVIVSRGESASSFTVRPLMAGVALGGCLLLMAGYLGAAGYMMMRSEPGLADAQARQTRQYEDRIADLRARIDRITSTSLIAQHGYERQIADLKKRQGEIDARHARVADVLARAAQSGLTIARSEPVPQAKPRPAAAHEEILPESIEQAMDAGAPATTGMPSLRGSMGGPARKADRRAELEPATATEPEALQADAMVMSRIDNALEVMDHQSARALDLIAVAAERRIARIERVTHSLGFDMNEVEDGVGGPFEPLVGLNFDGRLKRAESAVARLSTLRDGARSLPLAHPLNGPLSVSSNYGARLDPFLRKAAMHTGIDFRAPTGTSIHATAGGTVVSAGRAGGYGLMVEIDHGNGIVTRYGHMSRIGVSAGDTVAAGETIGQVGSTGRSTGSHLHYETRLSSRPVDPETFLNAGEKLAGIL